MYGGRESCSQDMQKYKRPRDNYLEQNRAGKELIVRIICNKVIISLGFISLLGTLG
jgi:hypothetical protein